MFKVLYSDVQISVHARTAELIAEAEDRRVHSNAAPWIELDRSDRTANRKVLATTHSSDFLLATMNRDGLVFAAGWSRSNDVMVRPRDGYVGEVFKTTGSRKIPKARCVLRIILTTPIEQSRSATCARALYAKVI